MSKTSKSWLSEHHSDQYVNQAKKLGYRSRASFKLIEIQEKYKLLKSSSNVVDLGASPGGWSQIISKYIKSGKLIALDLLEMPPLANVEFIQGDFSSDDVYEKLLETLGNSKLDCIVSDMAPNQTGSKSIDQARSFFLVELALEFARENLAKNGNFVAKVFQGAGYDKYLKDVKTSFNKVKIFKPKSSRPRSREVYIVAQGFKS